MRTVFMGTPEFSIPTLEALLRADYEVVAVVTQPDRPAGRRRSPVPSPVKLAAQDHHLRILQPSSLRSPEVVAELSDIAPEVIVVAAFGQILRRRILTLPPLGCLNLHPSLLPKLRGATPLPGAILARMTETGVSVMLLDEGLDTGPLLAQRRMAVHPDDNAVTLGGRLAQAGAELLIGTLPQWAAGRLEPQPQDDSLATYTRPLRREDGLIDWTLSADELDVRARAYPPWPGLYTHWQGRLLKIITTSPLPDWRYTAMPGQVIGLDHVGKPQQTPYLLVGTGAGVLAVGRVQIEGRQALNADQFVRGQPGIIGSRLG